MLKDDIKLFLNSKNAVEFRALQVDSDTAGGFAVKNQFYPELLKQEGASSVMRQICRILPPITGDNMPIPSEEVAMATSSLWLSEIGSVSEETTVNFGQRVLWPHRLAKLVKVSNRLIRTEFGEQWILEAIATAINSAQETAFVSGDGVGQPLGILGDPDLTVVQSGSATGATYDGLLDMIYGLPDKYHNNRTRILTSHGFYKLLMKTKSSDVYLHNMVSRKGELFGYPVLFTDALSGSVDSNGDAVDDAYAMIIGDFKAGYWIGDSDTLIVQRLSELYAEANETGLLVTQETDGAPVVSGAFVAMQIGTS